MGFAWAVADFFRSDVKHIVRHQINGACDGVLAFLKILSSQGRLFVDFFDDFLGLVHITTFVPGLATRIISAMARAWSLKKLIPPT
jgi:hypothetical protein